MRNVRGFASPIRESNGAAAHLRRRLRPLEAHGRAVVPNEPSSPSPQAVTLPSGDRTIVIDVVISAIPRTSSEADMRRTSSGMQTFVLAVGLALPGILSAQTYKTE